MENVCWFPRRCRCPLLAPQPSSFLLRPTSVVLEMSIDPRRSGIKNDNDGVLTWRFSLLSCLASCLRSKTQRVPGHLVDPLRNSQRVLGRLVDPLQNFQIGGNFVDPLQNSCYLKNSCCAETLLSSRVPEMPEIDNESVGNEYRPVNLSGAP